MEIECIGRQITVKLNDNEILAGNLDEFADTPWDGKEHTGLKRQKGRIALYGYCSQGRVEYRDLRIRQMNRQADDSDRHNADLHESSDRVEPCRADW